MEGKRNAKWYGYDHMRNLLWKEVYMGLDHANYELWKLQAYWLSICLNAAGMIRT